MKRLLATMLLSVGVGAPSLAQEGLPLPAPSTACDANISMTESRVQTIRGLTLVESGLHLYRDLKTSRPPTFTHSFFFLLQGSGGENLMNSPALMSGLATDVLSSCPHIGDVVFGIDQTDWSAIYGKRENGEVFAFKCVDAGGDVTPVWGEFVCP
jgi:hypothetical protein